MYDSGDISISETHLQTHFACKTLISFKRPDVFAHGPNDQKYWEPVDLHLNRVATLACEFAQPLDAVSFLQHIALWHDLGKMSDAWQTYLQKAVAAKDDSDAEVVGKIDHSSAGAQHAIKMLTGPLKPLGRIAAYCIAGHHGGLLNAGTKATQDIPGTLAQRLSKRIESVDIPAELKQCSSIALPALQLIQTPNRAAFQIAFWGRMLFSCLVDADFLATELHFNSTQFDVRQVIEPKWELWAQRVDDCIAGKRNLTTEVGRCRDEVYQQCVQIAKVKPGLFSLTVPTGGGKTFASLAFAMRHAQHNNLRRVIFALPFTSIIEQNAQVIRDVLEDDVVLEHHSNLSPEKENLWTRLAAENWDAPVVVTSNVQLFESLFASRTSGCRKLHRIVNSVIVLDEAQAIPVDLLEPCLAALDELVRNYGCTIVLCTATQPAVVKRDNFAIGLDNVCEIVAKPKQLFERMKRVTVKTIRKITLNTLADRMAEHQQVLAIVDTRKRAADLYQSLRHVGDVYHLSAAMCPVHRTECLAKIKECLKSSAETSGGDTPCHVVSTQLIEAGVDIDFPVVYRSLAGLDSIAQAAGRCNREGNQAMGEVFVFEPENGIVDIPKGSMRQAAQCTREVMPDHPNDLLNLAAIKQYFELHYWKRSDQWDKHHVMACFRDINQVLFDYAEAARRFTFIPQTQKPVVVSYNQTGHDLITQLQRDKPNRDLYRKAQRYTVQIPVWHWKALVQLGDIEPLKNNDRLSVLSNSSRYDGALGLCLGDIQKTGESFVS